MKFIDYKIKEISKVMAGGDKPKVCSDVYSLFANSKITIINSGQKTYLCKILILLSKNGEYQWYWLSPAAGNCSYDFGFTNPYP